MYEHETCMIEHDRKRVAVYLHVHVHVHVLYWCCRTVDHIHLDVVVYWQDLDYV